MGFTWKIEDLKLREEKLAQGMNFTVFKVESELSRDEKSPYILLYCPRGLKVPYRRPKKKKIKNVYIFDKCLEEDLEFYGETFKNWVEDELGLYAFSSLSYYGVAIVISYDKNAVDYKNFNI